MVIVEIQSKQLNRASLQWPPCLRTARREWPLCRDGRYGEVGVLHDTDSQPEVHVLSIKRVVTKKNTVFFFILNELKDLPRLIGDVSWPFLTFPSVAEKTGRCQEGGSWGHTLGAVAVVERWPLGRTSNKTQWPGCPPGHKKVALVERWLLGEVWL